MKCMILSTVAVLGLLFAEASADVQIIVRTPGVSVGVGVPYAPYYAPPAVVYPAVPYVAPGVNVGVGIRPAIGVGVGVAPLYRPYYGGYGYYHPYYRRYR